ncbi:lipocalin-like domain-containing protein [Ectothiorhodospira marina]|uniref:Predicted secreted hydrolase n=1 Tax=Ectothiorhodospira marina TaxID=1396821 RepID=A0A1H7PIG5_9GAMM|nr:lipocalin-like domain-containing protein [Ectothiorhodospira marina]SEL35409.1 Predicted secreted hydrolase [Ectothiorhodospira marina]
MSMIRWWSGGGLALSAVLLLAGCGEQGPKEGEDALAVSQALGGDDMEGYARALAPRDFQFPEDHAAHPAYRNEWWYVTGNLDDPEGRRFGFQMTFFRFALSPTPPESESTWATNQGWMAHLAVTDVAGDRHQALERFSRGGAGLAGAELDPFRVWLDDWELKAESGNDFPWRLLAAEGDLALDLRLTPLKDKVFQGDRGLSQKSPEPGNASYYFSMTRLKTKGTLRLGEQDYPVTGLSWMDREWSTSVLGENQVGWDWFSLQLDDGHDVMVYELRLEDGGVDPLSKGLWVEPDSRHQVIPQDAFELEVKQTWISPQGGTYPVAWHLRLPEQDRDLEIRAVREDQEMDLTVRYWEGAVDVFEAGQPAGRGFVEMTAY